MTCLGGAHARVATYFLLVVGFLLVAGKLFNSLRNMEVQMGISVVLTRNESPVLFWSVQCVAVGIYLALRATMKLTYTMEG